MAAVPDMDIGSTGLKSPLLNNPAFSHSKCPPKIHKSCFCVRFIAEHTKMQEDSTKVSSKLSQLNENKRHKNKNLITLPILMKTVLFVGRSKNVLN